MRAPRATRGRQRAQRPARRRTHGVWVSSSDTFDRSKLRGTVCALWRRPGSVRGAIAAAANRAGRYLKRDETGSEPT